ncbi:MAG: type IV toxin-antitoxin system AbiEi family antitoxin domain-containing protein [Sulfuricella sp.]|nr:type IV toxin-antitoxin system AbiEi family antitoxin domain-containing protein [Sulfuricella sp.]
MSSNSRHSLIKSLQVSAPRGRPMDLAMLDTQGVSAFLAAKHARSGWLKRLAQGVYAFAGDTLNRDQCLLFLQGHIPGLHVAGKTALAWQGVRHNLSLREHLMLWGDDKRAKLPLWFVGQFPASYRSTTLFSPKASASGIGTPPGILEGVRVSVPERAVLEMLYEVGKSQDMEEAKNLFESLRGLRFEVMGDILSQCSSVKTVRLFLLWARETEVLNVAALQEKYSLPVGSSSRWMGRMADGTLLSLPND